MKAAWFFIAMLAQGAIGSAQTACNAPALPITGTRIVNVSTEPQLQTAMGSLEAGDTIVLDDGTYNLTSTLYINGKNDVTIRGNSGCNGAVLVGDGMDVFSASVPHGIWSNSLNTTVAHLTIRDTWDNTLIFNQGAQSPHVYSVKLLNSGSQFIKANPTDAAAGIGVDNGVVEYSWMEYTAGTPGDHGAGVGYTNGISAHAADNWIIRGNVFKHFHTPDSADYLWNPAVLMWNHSANTVTERNTFINVDRAVAYGLQVIPGFDHQGGVIRNNFVYLEPNLMSPGRTAGSDGTIIAWDSPNTQIDQNTILTNANVNYAIEFRFASTTGGTARNNLADAPIHLRDSATATQSGNLLTAAPAMFIDPPAANLHLAATATSAIDQAPVLASVTNDFDGEARPQGAGYDIGADEFSSGPPPCLFCDDFNDGVLDPNWTYEKPAWTETGGSLRGTPPKKKAVALATPFAGCNLCSVESKVSVTGGVGNKAWILGWMVDKNNRVELLLKEEQDKVVLKQISAGQAVAKKKGTASIVPNAPAVFRIVFDGTQFTVLVDGNPVVTLQPVPAVPAGTVGFQVANTTAAFDYIQVQ